MNPRNSKSREGLLKSIVLAHTILIMHMGLVAFMGLLIFFFGGLVRYLFWIVLCGTLMISLSGYLFYRHLRREGRSLRDALKTPTFHGRAVEISFLGGMATFRLGPPTHPYLIDAGASNTDIKKLEAPETIELHDIEVLARLFEKNLITPEEYAAAKRRYFGQ